MGYTMKWMSSHMFVLWWMLSWWSWSSKRMDSAFTQMSTPPAPWSESRRFLRGSSCWRCNRGCCDLGTSSHPPTDQNDHCGEKRKKNTDGKRVGSPFSIFTWHMSRVDSRNRKWSGKHYQPPPMAKKSKSPFMKNEFSPVHLKHCRKCQKNRLQ